jgi:hypothetical protein
VQLLSSPTRNTCTITAAVFFHLQLARMQPKSWWNVGQISSVMLVQKFAASFEASKIF